ncbi:MAG: ribose 5-phosphate isomerase B [Dysgonomonas sp.]
MENSSLFSQTEKPIGIASDHAGFELKTYLISIFKEKGIVYKDFGTNSTESVDYPDYAHPLAIAVEKGECYPGIAICGTGNGINMTLNKHAGIRSALCWTPEIARLARAHNNANVLALPGRYISEDEAYHILIAFLNTPFEGGRHERRIEKIDCV